MNTKTLASCLSAGIFLILIAASCGQKESPESAHIKLLSNFWEMNISTPQSALDTKTTTNPLPVPEDLEKGFTIRCSVNLTAPTFDRRILEIPEVLEVYLRQHNPQDRSRQNYPAYKMPDGSVPVLEAKLALKSPVNEQIEQMIIGVPLAMLETPWGEHDVVFNFSGACWTMYVDGRLVDNDFPIGYPPAEKMNIWQIDNNFVTQADLYCPAVQPKRIESTGNTVNPQVQYWTPEGHNAWVGDVVSIFHDGRYHLFYLYDRRGHASKLGRGGHYFEHLSTADFIHWTEHEAAVPIEEQWETFGTGTPFVYNNQLCISYGYHTTRIYPYEETTLPEQYEFLKKHGYTGSFNLYQASGIPAGSSYSVSDDGVHFRRTPVFFHI